jgi:pyruvate kinase
MGGTQKVIAKIERKVAVERIDEIIAAADAIMIARGDLGNEIPLEEIPFVQRAILQKANDAHKPVITATQMMISMTEHDTPSRAEVSDVTDAILEGSDAVMLSEESASGKYPVQAIQMMKRIVLDTQQHMTNRVFNLL